MRGLRALNLLGSFATGTAVVGRTVATTRAGSPVAVAVAFFGGGLRSFSSSSVSILRFLAAAV